ncbi:antidote protein [Vibrio cholerae]|nr:antidote protein [Vibrio cholerae]
MLTAPVAIKLAAALGNTPEFWLNIQHAVDLWDTRNRYQEEAKLHFYHALVFVMMMLCGKLVIALAAP